MTRRPTLFAVRFLRLCLALLPAAVHVAAVSPPDETGHPVLRHYTPGEHLRGHAHQRITQDAAGYIYLANEAHLLCFDGARWHFIALSNESAGVRQFALTDDGTIFLAGAGVLGRLVGQGADTRFESLAPRLPPEARNIDELHSAVALGRTVYFADAAKILRWRDDRFSVIPHASPPASSGPQLHRVGDTLYVTAPGYGLGRIDDDRVEPVADHPILRENRIVHLVADGPDLLFLTAERGFHRLDRAGRLTPWPTAMDHWLAGQRVYCARRLADGSWVMGFSAVSGDGGVRFDPSGRYVGPLDTSIGLVVKTVRDFFPDREGGLWLGMDQGVARLEWPSPVSIFDNMNGLGRGAVADVLRHAGVLYAATSEGYFRLVPADGAGRTARFERVARRPDLDLPELFRQAPPGRPLREAETRLPHFARAAIGPVAQLREESGPGGTVLWACGTTGLARIEVGGRPEPTVPLEVRLRADGVAEGAQLPTKPPEIVFHFVAPRQRPTSPVTYQNRLVGHDDGWSDWSAGRTRAYAHLPSGKFRFEVRARDAAGTLSAPASLAFVVSPPWWATWWAIAGYLAGGAGAIAGYIRWHTRALRQRAAQLEQLVAQRTAELARQNAELIRLNQLELDEKISARLAEEKARLEMLRYQLNPHFLFNTLASISASLPAGGSLARTMVERLAEFCRLTLHRPDDSEWTTLGEELRLLRTYLEIERSRWGDLLDLDLALDPSLEQERLPHFLLLPLVENALKYGRATSPDRVGLRLAARRRDDGTLELEVANTGAWVEPDATRTVASLGIGLDNLRERLARYYPRSHRLAIRPADGWVTVTLHLTRRAAE